MTRLMTRYRGQGTSLHRSRDHLEKTVVLGTRTLQFMQILPHKIHRYLLEYAQMIAKFKYCVHYVFKDIKQMYVPFMLLQ